MPSFTWPALKKITTFIVCIDGYQPEDINRYLSPNVWQLTQENATVYQEARSVPVCNSVPSVTAILTGYYSDHSGIVGSYTLDRAEERLHPFKNPHDLQVKTIFEIIKKARPDLQTAAFYGFQDLADLFNSSDNRTFNDLSDDRFAANYHWGGKKALLNFTDPLAWIFDLFVGAPDEITMAKAIDLSKAKDPDIFYIHLAGVDFIRHAYDIHSPQSVTSVMQADKEIGHLVSYLKESGKWDSSVIIITADHSFTSLKHPIHLDEVFHQKGLRGYQIVPQGAWDFIFLNSHKADPRSPLKPDEQTLLKKMRNLALKQPYVKEAWYRLPNPLDGGEKYTIDRVHPHWHLNHEHAGELIVVAGDHAVFIDNELFRGFWNFKLIKGSHSNFVTRRIPFIIAGSEQIVKRGTIFPSKPQAINPADDTGILLEQAENVDITPTVLWLYGIIEEEGHPFQGRVLSEAFKQRLSPRSN
jgi:predicted AlkP superfamily pyrophosphatase or phosphodiesterase